MPGPKRTRRERTDEWVSIKQSTLWHEPGVRKQRGKLVARAERLVLPAFGATG